MTYFMALTRRARTIRKRRCAEDFTIKAKKDDALVVMLIGHGSFDGIDYKFQHSGPGSLDDRTGRACSTACLSWATARRQHDQRKRRIAYRSRTSQPGRDLRHQIGDGEKRARPCSRRYWVEALRDPAADADKNDSVTALEAFRYAEKKDQRILYGRRSASRPSNAVLEDTGHGEAVRDPESAENGQGPRSPAASCCCASARLRKHSQKILKS